ncbi:MAG: HAD-IIIA family hydrolase [Sedimentisphaerales bacterium]|nr:HAD-IIIA family hydrolase [Sedimentisphaerales bacterium]
MPSDIQQIKMLVMDVDGVLTDGGIIIHDDGSESKCFNVKDGAWLRIWQRQGLKTAIITGRQCQAVTHRAEQLEIDFVYQKAHNKLQALDQLVEESKIQPQEMAYVGDDMMDLPVLRRVGFAAAVADALPAVKTEAQFVTTKPGGKGAVQEIIEHLLQQMNLIDDALKRYQS